MEEVPESLLRVGTAVIADIFDSLGRMPPVLTTDLFPVPGPAVAFGGASPLTRKASCCLISCVMLFPAFTLRLGGFGWRHRFRVKRSLPRFRENRRHGEAGAERFGSQWL
jgi:hypothetical protein